VRERAKQSVYRYGVDWCTVHVDALERDLHLGRVEDEALVLRSNWRNSERLCTFMNTLQTHMHTHQTHGSTHLCNVLHRHIWGQALLLGVLARVRTHADFASRQEGDSMIRGVFPRLAATGSGLPAFTDPHVHAQRASGLTGVLLHQGTIELARRILCIKVARY